MGGQESDQDKILDGLLFSGTGNTNTGLNCGDTLLGRFHYNRSRFAFVRSSLIDSLQTIMLVCIRCSQVGYIHMEW